MTHLVKFNKMSNAPPAKRVRTGLKRSISFLEAAAANSMSTSELKDTVHDMQIARLSRKVRQLSGDIEKKNHFTSLSNTGVGTSGYLLPIDEVTQGDTSLQRSGQSIKPLYVDWRLILESETADPYNEMRMMIVQSKEGNLTSADFGGVNLPSNEIQLERYTVLVDKTWVLQNIHTGNAADPQVLNRMYHAQGRVKVPRKIYYPDGSAVSTRGSLYAWFISDSAVVNHPDVEKFDTKLTFQDA